MQTMQKFYKEIAQGASDDPQIRGVVALTKMSLDRLRTVKGPTRSWHIAHQKRALFRDGLVRWRIDGGALQLRWLQDFEEIGGSMGK